MSEFLEIQDGDVDRLIDCLREKGIMWSRTFATALWEQVSDKLMAAGWLRVTPVRDRTWAMIMKAGPIPGYTQPFFDLGFYVDGNGNWALYNKNELK